MEPLTTHCCNSRLDPVHSAQARQLLRNGKAAVFRKFPFTIILKESRPDVPVQPLRIKIDPGSKTTGIAVINDSTGEVVFTAELQHRGFSVRVALTSRRQLRRSRRARKSRYRQPRFNNRKRPDGWLPPSLMSRVYNIQTWVRRLMRLAPITAISQELVKFDTQLIQNPEMSGKEYQQGTLAGYETREYLLEKFGRKCVYCDKQDVPLQIEHIHPRAKGGTNRISNLTLSCEKCNIKKGTKDIKDFLKKDPEHLKKIEAQAKKQLADTAAVNASRFKLLEVLKSTGLLVETGSGGLTKFNRTKLELPKTHYFDAACVGRSTPDKLIVKGVKPLIIKATGHGSRQMSVTDKFGFPKSHKTNTKFHFGFTTGDIVRANVPKGKNAGTYTGRVTTRKIGQFDINTGTKTLQIINHKYCTVLQRHDGYLYLLSSIVH
ncbi:RNA-guided endonuclease IscB [Scytonema sp. PRP1]|uniref:RNA-guided endonuclease IscB n=1 Tax=Scytonema sp. PRP1 TaxID=3120513 RepID=UPI002FD4FC8D